MDNQFLVAANVDPHRYVEKYTLSQFVEEHLADEQTILKLLKVGLVTRERLFSLKERFEAAGIGVIYDRVLKKDNERLVILSNGLILKGKDGKEVVRLRGLLHVSFWCGNCFGSFELKTPTPIYDGYPCPMCTHKNTLLTSIDSTEKGCNLH